MKVEFSLAKDVQDFINDLTGKTEYAVKRGIYESANIFADKLNDIVGQLPQDYGFVSDKVPRGKDRLHGLLSKDIEGLIEGLGISKMEKKNGKITISIGFNGYSDYKTKTHPQGRPNALVARSLAKGTAYLAPNNFVNKAFRQAKAEAEQAFTNEFNRVMTDPKIK